MNLEIGSILHHCLIPTIIAFEKCLARNTNENTPICHHILPSKSDTTLKDKNVYRQRDNIKFDSFSLENA